MVVKDQRESAKSKIGAFCLLVLLMLVVILGFAANAYADDLILPADLRILGERAFYGDTSLDNVVLPERLRFIGAYAFAGSSVKTINLPSSLISIGENAFEGCDQLIIRTPKGSVGWQYAIEHNLRLKEKETVKIICPYGAGGVSDTIIREYAKAANSIQSEYNFTIEYLNGASGFIANTVFSEEDPNTKDILYLDYNVCYRVDAAARYDTEEVDFDLTKNIPFCTIDDRTWIMFGRPGTTLADVLAKAKDGGIKMSGGLPLSEPHLVLGTLILFEGGKLQPIPYDGGAEQKKGLIDGEVDVFVSTSPLTGADVKAGTLVPLLAFSDKPFEGFVGPDGNRITVPCIVGEGKAPELDPDIDYRASMIANGGGLATHKGCDPAFREDMIEIARKVWADDIFSGWVESNLRNNFQKYGDDAVDFYTEARAKAMNAYAILFGE